jgi:AraC-like DNA-binding protein
VLERQAQAQVSELWPEIEFLRRAERTYASAFARGETQLSVLSKELGVSSRTLQRKLRAHGTSHRDLLDRVRRQRALALLLSTASPLRVVARETGFAEPGAFCRAFRRWTGMSPGTYRRVSRQRSPLSSPIPAQAEADEREGAIP